MDDKIKLKKAEVSKINDDTYCFTESFMGADVYMYLLIGREKALLIDTAYGFTDIKAAVEEITSLPLTVVNTHAHLDHIHGNHFFDKVLIPQKDEECYERHMDDESIIQLLKNITSANDLPDDMKKAIHSIPAQYGFLPEEGFFELGDRKVTIIHTPGHTSGSICLLDEKNKWCFSGDTTCLAGVLLMFPESTSVETYLSSIRRLKRRVMAGKIEWFYPAHQATPVAPAILDRYEEGCIQLLAGEVPEEIVKRGQITVNTTAISFDPAYIRRTEEERKERGKDTAPYSEIQGAYMNL